MNANVEKGLGYVVVRSSSDAHAGLVTGKGYILTNASSQDAAGIIRANGYQLLANPATVTKANGYMFLNPGAQNPVFKQNGYVLWVPLFPEVQNFNVDFDFMEERFPDCVSFGSSGGPGFSTNVVEFDSGIVSTNAEWDQLRARYTVSFENTPPDEMKLVEDFFYTAKGKAIGFRFKDWKDYQIVQQNIGVGDGTTTSFQLFKRYVSGNQYYDRVIKKPLKVSTDGTDFALTIDDVLQTLNGDFFVNESTGEITFFAAPSEGSIIKVDYGEFDVPVRFDTDELDISFDEFRQLSLEIPLIEILV